jgi:hypothetical protein
MSEEFIPGATPGESDTSLSRERVRVFIVGSPKDVNGAIRTLYVLGFAQMSDWSPLQPTPNSGEFMSVMSRQILIN